MRRAAPRPSYLRRCCRRECRHRGVGWRSSQLQALIDQCLGDPYGPALGWCVALATERGAKADVERFLSIAAAAGVNDFHGRYRLVEDQTLPAIDGNYAILYGIDAYRRFTPWEMLSPGLLHLATR